MSDKNRAYIIWAIICQPHDSKASGSGLREGGLQKREIMESESSGEIYRL